MLRRTAACYEVPSAFMMDIGWAFGKNSFCIGGRWCVATSCVGFWRSSGLPTPGLLDSHKVWSGGGSSVGFYSERPRRGACKLNNAEKEFAGFA